MRNSQRRHLLAAALAVGLLSTACAGESGDDQAAGDGGASEAGSSYPDGPVEFLSGFEPGGGIDLAINTTMSALEEGGIVDVPLRINHRPGGSGLVAAGYLVDSQPEADDILQLTSISSVTASIQDRESVQIFDLTPIALLFQEYSIMYVRADSEFESVDDVVAAMKEDPSSVRFAGGSLGSPSNLALARLANAAGVDFNALNYVPLSGGETELQLLGGHVDVISGGPETMQQVEAGDMRALAISAEARVAGPASDVPTYTELGYDVVQGSWRGVFGPPEMPEHAREFWIGALEEAVNTDTFQQAAENNGWGVTYLGGSEFEEFLSEEEASLEDTLGKIGLLN